jgi:hypothetical protein
VLDQVGVAFPIGAPVITEVSLLRVAKYHSDIVGSCEITLSNLILQQRQFHGRVAGIRRLRGFIQNWLLDSPSPLDVPLSSPDHDYTFFMVLQHFIIMHWFNESYSKLVLQFI